MPLQFFPRITVRYEGKDHVLTESPVFNTLDLSLPVEGGLAGQTRLTLISFFLVFETMGKKKLMWVNMENCEVLSISNI